MAHRQSYKNAYKIMCEKMDTINPAWRTKKEQIGTLVFFKRFRVPVFMTGRRRVRRIKQAARKAAKNETLLF